MIKLTNILNELQVSNPNISAEKVHQYYWDNILGNTKFAGDSPGWKEYKQICKPYLIKYNIFGYITTYDFEKLSKPDLNKIYNEMRVLVQKYK